uniref:BACK domain-containing protein n=1 Tax=Romanomermis culicivorax TaxID=13658 RepID=A0A915KAX1_ROMCU
MSDSTKVEDDIHKPFSIKMDDHARQEKLMQFLRRQNKIFNYGLVVGEIRPPTTGPILGGPDLTLLVRGDRLAVHSLLFWFHCRDFAQWLQKHRCVSLPALVDLRNTELTYPAMRNIVDWVYEEEKDILLDMASAAETMYAAAYFGVDALLKIVQDYSLQVSLRKPKILLKWLNVAEKFECDCLYKNELYHMAATHFQSLLKVDPSEIGQLSSSALVNLLRREDLNVQTEIDPFKLALIWIKINRDQTGKRTEIDSIFQSIRFVTMPLKEKQLCWKMVDQEDPEILNLLEPYIMLADWHQTCKSNDRQRESDLKEQFRKHVLTGALAPVDGSLGSPKSEKTPIHLPSRSLEYPPGDLSLGMNSCESRSSSLALSDPEFAKEESTAAATQRTARTKIDSGGNQSETQSQEETSIEKPLKLKEQERKDNGLGLPSLQPPIESGIVSNVSKIVDVEQQQKAEIIDSGQPVCFHFETTQTRFDPQGKKLLTTFKYDFKNPDSTTTDTSCKHKHLWKTTPSKRG